MPYQYKRDSRALRVARWLLGPLRILLKTEDDHATFDRLFTSQHVCDLQLIAGMSFLGVVIVIAVGLCIMLYQWSSGELGFLTAFTPVTTVFAPVLAVWGGILAWVYKAGSERLGVVDSFSCEIGTLCRAALVVDAVGRSIDRFRFRQTPGERDPRAPQSGKKEVMPVSGSQENYFPIFENGTKDLQVLEAKVVVNITAFYTFMKAVRDLTRSLAGMQGAADQASGTTEGFRAEVWAEVWRERMSDLIYMMFLGLESARRALNMLVEYEPDHDELVIIALLSELKAYGFLCRRFSQAQDMRHEQLTLRQAVYEEWVPKVCASVEAGQQKHRDWGRAYRLLPELQRTYEEAMPGRSMAAGA